MRWFEPLSEIETATARLAIDNVYLPQDHRSFEERLAFMLERTKDQHQLTILRHAFHCVALLCLQLHYPMTKVDVQVIDRATPYRHPDQKRPRPVPRSYIYGLSRQIEIRRIEMQRGLYIPSGWCCVSTPAETGYKVRAPEILELLDHPVVKQYGGFRKYDQIYFSKLCWRVTKKAVYWNPHGDEIKQAHDFLFGRNPPPEVLERFHAQTRPRRASLKSEHHA